MTKLIDDEKIGPSQRGILPIRFDRDGFELRVGGRWHVLPFAVTLLAISALLLVLFWVFLHGPTWASLIAIAIIVLSSAALVTALVWTGTQAHASWFVARWYRLPIGFAIAVFLIVLETTNFRWPSGEAIDGYLWGGVIAVICVLAWLFGWRQSRLVNTPNIDAEAGSKLVSKAPNGS